MKMEIGDPVVCTSRSGINRVSGVYEGDQKLGYLGGVGYLVRQPNGVVSLIREQFYSIEVVRPSMTRFELELKELIADFRKKNWPDELILEIMRKVLEEMK